MKNIVKMYLIFFYLLIAFGCSNEDKSAGIRDKILPAHEFPKITGMETALVVDDIHNFNHREADMTQEQVQLLKDAGVKQIARVLYSVDKSDRTKVIVGEVFLYESKQRAIEHLTSLISNGLNNQAVEVSKIGDKAYKYRNKRISFVKGNVGVGLTEINTSVDVQEFAQFYADWINN